MECDDKAYCDSLTHQSKAFLKMAAHGDLVMESFHSRGAYGHCHNWVQRSGCGIMARWRPF